MKFRIRESISVQLLPILHRLFSRTQKKSIEMNKADYCLYAEESDSK